MYQNQTILFDVKLVDNIGKWYVVDDVVMGGRSSGALAFGKDNAAVFKGNVSLANNGGFSSIRYAFDPIEVESKSSISIRLKGDGKKYQFRLKANRYDRQSYIYNFDTSGEWETIIIPLSELAPTFRGRRLAIPNFEGETFSEIGFLIGNKKEESFWLEFDQITLH